MGLKDLAREIDRAALIRMYRNYANAARARAKKAREADNAKAAEYHEKDAAACDDEIRKLGGKP